MAVSWPGTLPQNALVGFTRGAAKTALHFESTVGPGKSRTRYSDGPKPVTTRLVLTKAQVATLLSFFTTTLGGGALPFEWEDPIDDSAVTMRFRPGTEPQVRLEVGGTASQQHYTVMLDLEIIPAA